MIKKLALKDFKTHQDTKLEFSPGINIITGDSGHGKTNILLALNWVVNNRPLGSSCIRRGQDSGAVKLDVDENGGVYSIVRKRGKTENSYTLRKDDKDVGDSFTSFGGSPPKEILEILNLSDINVQKQRDPYFLVYTPPGQVAIYIRTITKLDEIDQAIKLLSGKVRSEGKEISYRQDELKSTSGELDDLKKIDLEQLETKITEAKVVLVEIETIKSKVQCLENIVGTLKTLEELQIFIPDNIDQIFDEVDRHSESISEKSKRITELKTLIDELKLIEADKIVLPEDLSILSTSEEVVERHNGTNEKVEILLGLIEEIKDVELEIADVDNELKQLGLEEKQLMSELDVCPSCEQKLTPKAKLVLLERVGE